MDPLRKKIRYFVSFDPVLIPLEININKYSETTKKPNASRSLLWYFPKGGKNWKLTILKQNKETYYYYDRSYAALKIKIIS